MSIETPTTISLSPLRSPTISRTSSFVGKPRKPSPLRRSSTPDDTEVRQRRDGASEDGEEPEVEVEHEQGRRASEGRASLSSSSSSSSHTPPPTQFTSTSLSKSTSNLSEMTTTTPKTISNTRYTLPPIRATPKFPHSTSIRPLRPLSSVSGNTTSSGVGSLTSVPHAGLGTHKAPQRQKIIVPSKSWKACFDLNLTQKELARFD